MKDLLFCDSLKLSNLYLCSKAKITSIKEAILSFFKFPVLFSKHLSESKFIPCSTNMSSTISTSSYFNQKDFDPLLKHKIMNASIATEKLGTRRVGPFSLNSLFADFPERQARKGDTLVQQNHSLGYIFYLTEGMVKSINFYKEKKKEIVNGYFIAGEMMNLDILNKNLEVSSTLKVSSTKAVYKVIPIQEFIEMVRRNQGLNQLVMTTILDKMTKSNDRLQRLLMYKSRQRVIQFLLDYAMEVGQRVGYEHVIKNPFTHEEIGNLSDTSRQTVTTVLNILKSKNIIHFTRRYIIIRNLEELTIEATKEKA